MAGVPSSVRWWWEGGKGGAVVVVVCVVQEINSRGESRVHPLPLLTVHRFYLCINRKQALNAVKWIKFTAKLRTLSCSVIHVLCIKYMHSLLYGLWLVMVTRRGWIFFSFFSPQTDGTSRQMLPDKRAWMARLRLTDDNGTGSAIKDGFFDLLISLHSDMVMKQTFHHFVANWRGFYII